MQLLALWPTCKDALKILSVLGSFVSLCDVYDRIAKALDELQNFVSKAFKNILTQVSWLF
jgi:hypothetical protein